MAKAAGNKGLVNDCDSRIKEYRNAYDKMCDSVGLEKHYDRMGVVDGNSVANSANSGIIKNIKLEDIKVVTQNSKIQTDVIQKINEVLTKRKSDSLFDSVAVINDDPHIALQTEPVRNGTFFNTKLNLNNEFLGGMSVSEIDNMFAGASSTVANSLEEALIHEEYHARLIHGLNYSQVEALYDVLSEVHITGISKSAFSDGAECIAETGLLIERKAKDIPQEALDLFYKYIGG